MDEDRVIDIVFILAFIAVIVLKCIGIITISWLWLTAIIWIPFCMGIIVAIGFFIAFAIETLIDKLNKEKKNERY